MEMISSMNENWSTLVLALACCVTFAVWWNGQRSKNAPPGPSGLPYIGSFIQLRKSIRNGTTLQYLMDLHRQYGPVVAVKVGVQRLVYINDGKLIAHIFQKPEFSLKPVKSLPIMRKIAQGSPRGIALNNGESHKEMRRFAMLALRDFGVGKKSLDELIQTEATILCQQLEKLSKSNEGVLFDLKINVQYATVNLLHNVIFGHRYDYDDPKWKDLVQTLYQFFGINSLAMPENFFPILGRLGPLNRLLTGDKSEKQEQLHNKLAAYIESQIEDHRETYVGGEIRDFIDLYIEYESKEREFYTKENIFAVIFDLFKAGSDTSATFLTWAVLYLVKHPDIQKQVRAEIDEVVGERAFDKKDKHKLVKTRAFINEVQRYVSVASASPAHTVEKPEVVNGYTLLPNDMVLANLYTLHHDKDYWGDPNTFRIDRWIDEKGELIKHDGHFYPFSVGKRVCPGRQFANLEVMFILVCFLQNFTFDKAKGYPELTEDWIDGFIRSPKSLYFQLTKRH